MTHRITLLLTAALVTLATACTQQTETPRGTTPIGFVTRAQTRAAVTGTADMRDFRVWGGYGGELNLLNAETVRPDGSYVNTAYWVDQQTHYFFALHPATLDAATCDATGTRTLAGFNATDRRGDEAIDLMTAEQTGLFFAKGTAPAPVSLTFTHRLCRVRLSIATEQAATVTAVGMADVLNEGDFSYRYNEGTARWDATWSNLSATPFGQETALDLAPEDAEPATLMGGDLLMIPQTLAGEAVLAITWQYAGDPTEHTAFCPIAAATPAGQWAEGKSYNYRFLVPANESEADVTLKVTVGEWNTPQNVEVIL